MTTPAALKRDWALPLSLGMIEDRNGKRRKVAWPLFGLFGLLLPAFAIFAIYRAATTSVPMGIWLMAFALYSVSVLGVNIYYHRGLTHRGLAFPKWVEVVLSIAAALSWQGNAWDWVTKHRRHHTNADVVGEDPHSPWEYPGWLGLMWAQWFWLFFEYDMPAGFNPRDLRDNPRVQWQVKPYGFFLYATLGLIVPFCFYGWNGLLIAGVLRIACSMTAVGFVNSWCHMWGKPVTDSLGREFVSDDSTNSVLVALVTFGEGNHSGHHAEPGSPCHGWHAQLDEQAIADGILPDNDWRPDLTWRVIKLMAKLRLATILQAPPSVVYFNDRGLVPKPALRAVHASDFTLGGRRKAMADQIKLNEAQARDAANSAA